MKHPLVIALRGVPDVGKTTTLKMLSEFLRSGYIVESLDFSKDIRDVIEFQGKKIVIATCGDNQAYMEKNIDFFNQHIDADAYICAVRSWGITNDKLEEFAESKQAKVIYIDKYKGDDIFKANVGSVYDIMNRLSVSVPENSVIVSSEEYIHVAVYAYGDYDSQERSLTVDFARKEELDIFTENFNYQVRGGEYAPTYIKLYGLSDAQEYEEGYYTLYISKHHQNFIKSANLEDTEYAFYMEAADRAIILLKSKKVQFYCFPYDERLSRWKRRLSMALYDYEYWDYPIDSLVVKKVGNANFNELCTGTEVSIVYDFGLVVPKGVVLDNSIAEQSAERYSAQKQQPILIISHWDRDHYNLLNKLSKDVVKASFLCVICPNIFFSESAIRAFKKILDSHIDVFLLPVFPEAYHRPKSNVVSLCKDNPYCNPRIYISIKEKSEVEGNDCCVALTVCGTNGKLAALTGDMAYSRVLEIASDVDYLVVPHHGSYLSIDGTKNVKMIPTVREEALISAAGLYGHPHQNTIHLYALKKINCFCTHKCGATSPYLTYVNSDILRNI